MVTLQGRLIMTPSLESCARPAEPSAQLLAVCFNLCPRSSPDACSGTASGPNITCLSEKACGRNNSFAFEWRELVEPCNSRRKVPDLEGRKAR